MAYNEKLSNRVRERIADINNVEEKRMFGGICFMVNGKMCIGVSDEEMMCRVDPDIYDHAMERKGTRAMDFTGKTMKGFIFVNEDGLKTNSDFEYWINLCLDFNKRAKAAPKKKKKTK